jgi:hypothetical protein
MENSPGYPDIPGLRIILIMKWKTGVSLEPGYELLGFGQTGGHQLPLIRS